MPIVFGILFLASFAGLGAIAIKLYERHLDAQVGPWMASELSAKRSRPRLVRQRANANER